MRRSLLLALLSALLVTGLLAGCGGDDKPSQEEVKKEYDDAFKPINDDLLEQGEEVGQAVNNAEGTSDEALATQFTGLGEDTEEIKTRLDELEPPDEYEDDHNRLSKAIETVATDLREIGEAAEASDPKAARTQAAELVRHSVEVRTARRALARKTGAKVEGSGS